MSHIQYVPNSNLLNVKYRPYIQVFVLIGDSWGQSDLNTFPLVNTSVCPKGDHTLILWCKDIYMSLKVCIHTMLTWAEKIDFYFFHRTVITETQPVVCLAQGENKTE